MFPKLLNPTTKHDENAVRAPHGGESVRHRYRDSIANRCSIHQRFLYNSCRLRVQRTCCLIKQEQLRYEVQEGMKFQML